jgi:hypothetical protein
MFGSPWADRRRHHEERRLDAPVRWRRRALQPTPNAGLVAEIDGAELALEIGFFAGDHAIADDKIEWHQRGEYPEAVEADGEADLPQENADVDRVVGEAVGPLATIAVVGL